MAARKRLNVKFLVIGACALLFLCAAVVGYKFRKRIMLGSPDKLMAEGKQLLAEGNYKEAGKKFYDAGTVLKGGGSPELYVLIGDVHNHMVGEHPENFNKARGFWEGALTSDPRYIPALSRLLDTAEEIVDARPTPESFKYLRETANRMLAVDPDHKRAQFLMHRATIQRWRLSGEGEVPRSTAQESIDALQKMLEQDPAHAEAMEEIFWGKLNLALASFRAGDDAGARRYQTEIIGLIEGALAKQPQNGAIHLAAAQAWGGVAHIERQLKGDHEQYEKLVKDHQQKAIQLLKPEDPKYRDAAVGYAFAIAAENKDLAGAEKICRDLMQRYPDDVRIWMHTAEVLGRDPKRVREAIQLLSQPLPDMSKKGGYEALRTITLEPELLYRQLSLRLNNFPTIEDPAQRQAELKTIEDTFARFQSKMGEDPSVLMTRGRIQIYKNDWVGAIQSLEHALRIPGAGDLVKAQTMDLLARAYKVTNQYGQAKRLLNELIAQTGERTPVNLRMNLAQILLAENNIEDAKPQIDLIAKELPETDPQLIRLRIQVLDKEKDKDQRHKLFAQLPQGDRQQTLEKARFAMVEMREEELGLGLLESLRASDPADPLVVQTLANYYLTKQQKDKAQQIVDEALAKAPDNVGLQMAKRQLAAETPEQMQALQEQAVQSITDPFRKEIQLFNIAVRENNVEQARAHLANAEKMKPEDRTLLELLYTFNLSQKDFDKAGQYLERLEKVDPGSVEIHRVRFAIAKGDLNRALELANQLVRDRGEFAVSHITLADVQRARNSLVEAANAYKAALERDTRNFEAMRGLIDVYYALSQPVEAKRYIDIARRVFPNNPQIKEWQLAHEVQFGDPEVAIEPRKEQLEQDKENPTNWLALGQVYSAAGRDKQNDGKDEEAKSFFTKAKETFDTAYAKWPDDPRLAMAVAQISIPLKKTEDGEKALQALIARPAMQGKIEPTIALAEFQVYAGRPAEGEKTLRGLFEQNKQDLSLQLRLLELIMRENRIDEAIELLKINGDNAMIRQVRIETLVRSGRLEDAQKELDAVLAGSQPTPGLHYLQGLIHKASSRLSEAIASFDKALQMEPKMAWALYQRGVVRGMRGDVDGAIKDLSTARDLMPQLSDARIKLADMYRAQNDPTAATRELESAVRAAPADKALRLALVEQYRQQIPPRWSEAERVFREAKNIPTLARDAGMLQAEARMWSDRNDPQRAVACIKEAANVAPHDLSITRTFFDVLIKAKAYRDVLAASDRMLKANQHMWWIYQARGTAKARNNDKDGAVTEFETGLKYATEQRDDSASMAIIRTMAQEVGFAAAMNRVEPKAQNDNRWRLVAMQLCRSQGDFNGALRWGQMLLNDSGFTGNQREAVMFAVGEVYVHLGQFDKAVEMYKQLAQSHPDDPSILNNLAAVMTLPNSPTRPEDALPYSQKAFDLMRRAGNAAPEVLDTHGWILVMVGRVDDGILLLQEALDRKQFPDAYYHLGDAYLRQSKPVEAERALRQAKEMIARAEREKQAVDPTLSQRVEEALIRASALMQQKSQAGTNN